MPALAPLLASIVPAKGITHLIASHSAIGKDIFPRVSALYAQALAVISQTLFTLAYLTPGVQDGHYHDLGRYGN
jgi:hypothetical protein